MRIEKGWCIRAEGISAYSGPWGDWSDVKLKMYKTR